jgi:hypothetical protein
MPVRKFRTIEEMNAFDVERRRASIDDPNLAQRIASHAERSRALTPPLDLPKGVHKFRSIEEMNAFKDRYVQRRIDSLRSPRQPTKPL